MDSITRSPAKPSRPAQGLASWYAPGLIDGFGDRLLMFDNTEHSALEMLRFHTGVASLPGFEEVLRDRVRALGRLTDEAFPVVCAVERLEADGALALVSTHMPGKPLSSIFPKAPSQKGLHPAFVTWVVSQIVKPLSVLQAQGDDIAHSALTADRIILTSGGQVRVIEHALGAVLNHLNLSRDRLWRDFGLLAPNGTLYLDARADVFQVGVLALSMLLGRRVTPTDLGQRLPAILDEWSETVTPRARSCAEPLRQWLQRALQIGESPYHSAAEGLADLRELPSASASRALEYLQAEYADGLAKLPAEALAELPPEEENHMALSPTPDPASAVAVAPPQSRPLAPIPEPHLAEPPTPDDGDLFDMMDLGRGAAPPPAPAPPNIAMARPDVTGRPSLSSEVTRLLRQAIRERAVTRLRLPGVSWRVAAALAALAVGEAVVIAMLVMRPAAERPGSASATPSSTSSAPVELVALNAATMPVSNPPAPAMARSASETGGPGTTTTAAIERAARNQRSGGVRLSAPIELTVLQGDRVLGSTADGPIVAQEGTHQLEFLNTALGFRARQAVTFRAGEITTLSVPVPAGRISVNAQPWAEVWIDNRPVGETPLANLDIALGEHEIVFRHPELGERRQNVTVRADSGARVSMTFDR